MHSFLLEKRWVLRQAMESCRDQSALVQISVAFQIILNSHQRYNWLSPLIIRMLFICLVVPPSTCLAEAKEIIMTCSFPPVHFHVPQRVSSTAICPAFLSISFPSPPSLDHLTHCVDSWVIAFYSRVPFNRSSGHCLINSTALSEGLILLQKNRETGSRDFLQEACKQTPLPQTFISLPLHPSGEISILSAPGSQISIVSVPASHADFFPKNTQPLTLWGRKMQPCHSQRAPRGLTLARSNSSSLVHHGFSFPPRGTVLVYLVDIVTRTRPVLTSASFPQLCEGRGNRARQKPS